MRWVGIEERSGARILGALAIVALVAMFAAGSAAAAGNKKLVEGTVFDTTCAGLACGVECPPPPHCGPITAAGTNSAIVCPMAARMIACPLSRADVIVCVQAEGCPGTTDPVYSGEGGVVKVRNRGATTVLTTVPIVEGHFKVRLAPGEYMMRPFLPEPQCWAGTKIAVLVSTKLQGPVPASLWVENSCVAHPDAAK
jgi:hypothetical protein